MKFDLIRLGEQLSAENVVASDLWSWLPSHKVAVHHHGDYATAHTPSNSDVMKEALLYVDHLRHPEVPLTPEQEVWFTSCPCGDAHAPPHPEDE